MAYYWGSLPLLPLDNIQHVRKIFTFIFLCFSFSPVFLKCQSTTWRFHTSVRWLVGIWYFWWKWFVMLFFGLCSLFSKSLKMSWKIICYHIEIYRIRYFMYAFSLRIVHFLTPIFRDKYTPFKKIIFITSFSLMSGWCVCSLYMRKCSAICTTTAFQLLLFYIFGLQ